MAPSMSHMAGEFLKIKSHSKWKPVALDIPIASAAEIEGLIGIEELTGYTIERTAKRKTPPIEKEKCSKRKRVDKSEKSVENFETKKASNIEKITNKRNQRKNALGIKSGTRSDRLVKMQPINKEARKEIGTLDYRTADDNENIDMNAWKDLFVPKPLLKALASLGYTSPTAIQSLTLPSAIRDKMDIVGAAETGSGKTLAFGIPMIHSILEARRKKKVRAEEEENNLITSNETDTVEDEKSEEIKNESDFGENNEYSLIKKKTKKIKETNLSGLVLTPTRELAVQVRNHLRAVCKFARIKIIVIVGGMSMQKQERLLSKKPHIIVATPGRLWELIQMGNEYLSYLPMIRSLVIDEADRMLEKGHFEELINILTVVNSDEEYKMKRQTFVFSATLTLIHDVPKRLLKKRKKKNITANEKLENLMEVIGMKDHPKIVDITSKLGTVETLTETRINCSLKEKDFYLYYFLSRHPGRTLIFCNSVDCVRRLSNLFTILKCQPFPLHSSMHQKQRLKNLERFASNENGLLFATDVAARGLDIPDVQHVIHYQIPRTSETYIHRSGRTARALKDGLSIMFIEPEEIPLYRRICKTLNRDDDIPHFPVDLPLFKLVQNIVNVARELDVKEHRYRKQHAKNNWFEKAAREMDIDITDENLIEDFGDDYEKSQREKELKSLRKRLEHLLKQPLIPKGFSGRYPTQRGKLKIPTITAPVSALEMAKKEEAFEKSVLLEGMKLKKRRKKKKQRNRGISD